MLIRPYPVLVALSLLASTVAAQNIQTNNQGVIINVIVPSPRLEQHLYHPDNVFQANVMETYQAQQQAAANQRVKEHQARAAIKDQQNALGTPLNGTSIWEANSNFILHSALEFDAPYALGWSIAAGTRFRFITSWGPGGHAEIQLLGLKVAMPAEFNGLHFTPGTRSNGYVEIGDLRCTKTSETYQPIDEDEAATFWNSLK